MHCSGDRTPFVLPASATELAVRVLGDRSIVEIFLAHDLVRTARIALDVKVILTPPCIFH